VKGEMREGEAKKSTPLLNFQSLSLPLTFSLSNDNRNIGRYSKKKAPYFRKKVGNVNERKRERKTCNGRLPSA
jgi:hypothetical protein